MTHKEFRAAQAVMDGAGMLTHIRTIRVSKTGKQVNYTTVFTYKYRYEVIVNGDILKKCKSRKTAKDFLIEYFEAKQEYEAASAKLAKTCGKLNTRGRISK